MDEIYHKIAEFNLRRLKHSHDILSFKYSELWCNDATGIVDYHEGIVTIPDVALWLATETRKGTTGPESLIFRFVWPKFILDENRVELPEDAKDQILEKFGLGLAYSYFSSCVAGVVAFPEVDKPDTKQQAYSFCYAPKLASIWSCTSFKPPASRPSVTYGVILAGDKEQEGLKTLLKSRSRWQLNTASHALFPAFLFAFMFHGEIEITQNNMKPGIQQIEARTGYSDFKTKRKHIAAGELGPLSAQMSGFAVRLASTERKAKTVQKLLEFSQEQLHTGESPAPVADGLMEHHVGVLQRRLAMQAMDREYTLKRVQIQIDVLNNLISENYSLSNSIISISTLRDAASMKTLAFVTMFFLPGSFISALFSTDLFDWDNTEGHGIGIPATPQFRLYWAITIPLTVVTFILYFIWAEFSSFDRSQRRERKRWGFPRTDSMESEEVQTRSPLQVLKDQRERMSEAYAMAKKRQFVFGRGEKDESMDR
ncbi:hypothetical protein FLAG1_03297 [Fusarium langsethiae]|uniref:Uncharacterized protein n=1 Tax=Fusarium langsethiae TaxID=179993 RepID=A0A0M9F0R8_FUSLA|nr:hypothetical protein FLAG1_03297 [Fusarium langsethiae]GKU01171.1 unnamed protein product [Fusarium langsethiae]GKU12659.1 unnamed protein product [Fusarium langsethiae]